MPSDMRRPDIPNLDHFYYVLENRLQTEVVAAKRFLLPKRLNALFIGLRKLAKPIAQSAAMALTGLAVIIAVGATPAATKGDLARPLTSPISAPSETEIVESDQAFLHRLSKEETLAVQEADILDTSLPPEE